MAACDHRPDIAITAATRAAAEGDTDTMSNLGNLLKQRGDSDEAETWYQRAAKANGQ